MFIYSQIIEHLSTNVNLMYMDLSSNSISYITNLSHLLKLEVSIYFK